MLARARLILASLGFNKEVSYETSPYTACADVRFRGLRKLNLDYIMPDVKGGKMDTAAHQFRGREEEVLRMTLEWLKKHKLSP